MKYDIIGDIHGCHLTLEALLGDLGYHKSGNIDQHSDRKMIFLGDFIDRGPGQREVLDIVRPMIESGLALSVMGNHEFNAIAYATTGPDERYLREHSEKNLRQHRAFLNAYEDDPAGYQSTIEWFKTLPLWLDLGELRIVHACWDTNLISKIEQEYDSDGRMSDQLLVDASNPDHWAYDALETLLKGKEIPLPGDSQFKDKDGNVRRQIRVRWWDQEAKTYQSAFMGPASATTHIPDDPIEGDHMIEYGHTLPPVFLGHYWMEGEAKSLASNIACLDYSVAKPGGKLVAYRWEGESVIDEHHFVSVDRLEG
jgi:hypothetical protein